MTGQLVTVLTKLFGHLTQIEWYRLVVEKKSYKIAWRYAMEFTGSNSLFLLMNESFIMKLYLVHSCSWFYSCGRMNWFQNNKLSKILCPKVVILLICNLFQMVHLKWNPPKMWLKKNVSNKRYWHTVCACDTNM